MTTIRFFSEKEKYGEFSNFYPLDQPLIYEGKSYPTSEHLYQAFKFFAEDTPANREYAELIRTAVTPYQSKLLGHQTIGNRYGWQEKINGVIREYRKKVTPRYDEEWKLASMKVCLRLKFQSNPDCLQKLLESGDSLLEEDSPYDDYWGTGRSGKGQNHLGRLLMEERSYWRWLNGMKMVDGKVVVSFR